jgi:hypothetical protein
MLILFCSLVTSRGVDVRKLPSLIPDKHARNLTGKMVLFEMQRHLARIRADPSLASGSGSSTDETGKFNAVVTVTFS